MIRKKKGLFGGSDAYWPPKVYKKRPRLIQLAYQRMLAKQEGDGRRKVRRSGAIRPTREELIEFSPGWISI